jgi:hypothetical protein
MTKWLFIQFYVFSYIETISILNTIPGYSKKLWPMINTPITSFNAVKKLENISKFFKFGAP